MKFLYAVWTAFALSAVSLECFRVLQATNYRPSRGYFKIICSYYYLILLALCAFGCFCGYFLPIKAVVCAIYTLVAVILACLGRKTPLKFTNRILRMLAVEIVLLAIASVFTITWSLPILPIFAWLSWLVCLPVDRCIGKKFLKQASCKLKNSELTVIAITGSYGKTSTKEMLASLLNDSIAPCGSCNTPLGIAKFVNNTDLSKYRYLILEFGARQRGDIAELCKLFSPKYGIVTGVCEQHLSTFKNFENIVATKRELVENLPNDGVCVLCDESVQNFANYGVCKKVTSVEVKVVNTNVSVSGLKFDVVYGDETYQISLPQITPYSAKLFSVCATLCLQLGQKFSETVSNAQRVAQVPHRMQIIHNGRFYIIDDSYNASIEGVAGCCDIMSRLEGVKVVVAQGIVECGAKRCELNERCGKMLGEVFDTVIVLGKNSNALKVGASNSACKCILKAKSLSDAVFLAQKILPENGFLLFQNDLPDIANI